MPLYSEEIEVQCAGDVALPVSFAWREKEYHVESILQIWQDFRFPSGAPRKRTWRLRRHRNYFVVRTSEGPTFEIYLDRGAAERKWILCKEIQK